MRKTKIPTIVALIPARSGSKRLSDKNIRPLSGHPLMAYTIAAAFGSKIFSDVIVSTDSEKYAEIARYYGAEIPFMRPSEFSGDLSPDIEWVEYTLKRLKKQGRDYDCFSILRPTNPFRQPETIQSAWQEFLTEDDADSLRAVQKCDQHPGKMWIVSGRRMTPLLSNDSSKQPWHSMQYQSLPEVYVQNASLEIAWSRVVLQERTIAGHVVIPFVSKAYEGFDLNKPYDWQFANHLIQTGQTKLPPLLQAPYPLEEFVK